MSTILIERKRSKAFKRHQADRFMRIGGARNKVAAWRRPRGIDNIVRRGFSGQHMMPGKGYRNNKDTRYRCVNLQGKYSFRVCNERQMDMLLMHSSNVAAEIASQIGARKRSQLVGRAAQLGVTVANKSKLRVKME